MSYEMLAAMLESKQSEANHMLTIHQGEERNGRIKYSDDVDCLSCETMRYTLRVFPCFTDVMAEAHRMESRGFTVCVDTFDYFYETPEAN
jgi:hypothetical protein